MESQLAEVCATLFSRLQAAAAAAGARGGRARAARQRSAPEAAAAVSRDFGFRVSTFEFKFLSWPLALPTLHSRALSATSAAGYGKYHYFFIVKLY